MFGLLKPAHVRLRKSLPEEILGEYDEIRQMTDEAIPTYWPDGARDRAITLVMAEWVISNAHSRRHYIPRAAYVQARHLEEVCREFNERDPTGHGSSSTFLAMDLIRAYREADIIPSSDEQE